MKDEQRAQRPDYQRKLKERVAEFVAQLRDAANTADPVEYAFEFVRQVAPESFKNGKAAGIAGSTKEKRS